MSQLETTEQPQMTQGRPSEGPRKQNVQLVGAGELEKWNRKIGPRSLAAAERCRKQPDARQQQE